LRGGRLPIDHEAHRVGQPDLLVRHGEGYLPIEGQVATRRSSASARRGPVPRFVCDVTSPFFYAAVVDVEHNPRKHLGDLMQLAHYRALLDAAGIASLECFAAGSAAPRV